MQFSITTITQSDDFSLSTYFDTGFCLCDVVLCLKRPGDVVPCLKRFGDVVPCLKRLVDVVPCLKRPDDVVYFGVGALNMITCVFNVYVDGSTEVVCLI